MALPAIARRGPTAGKLKRLAVNPANNIPVSQAMNAVNALFFSEQVLKRPLNTSLTVVFKRAKRWDDNGKAPFEAVRERMLKSLTNWFHRHDIPPLYVYGAENDAGGGRGPHLHMLLHLPEEHAAELRENLATFLHEAGGFGDSWGSHHPVLVKSAGYPLGALRYAMGGVCPDEVVQLRGELVTLRQLIGEEGIRRFFKPQAPIETRRRAGASRALCQSERAAHGWQEIEDPTWLRWEPSHRVFPASSASTPPPQMPSPAVCAQAGAAL